MMRGHFLLSALLTSASLVSAQSGVTDHRISVIAGKSQVIDCPSDVRRVAMTNPAVAEVMVISSREVMVNGLAPGETTLTLWMKDAPRVVYDVDVNLAVSALTAVREQLARELGEHETTIDLENGTVFLRGTVKDQGSADRAVMIAGSLGKVVNLLYVNTPPADAQILLKVRFANVDRAASTQLGANLMSTGTGSTLGVISTGQFAPPVVKNENGQTTFSLSDALNLFLFRSDLNLGATIKALQSRNLLEILAEPNLLATDRKTASFLAGGEFPFPTVQGGANAGAVTISFREFGIRIGFLPVVTPRGSIRLHVTPEVSSLDFANGLVFQGSTIPAISTRRVDTEVELESGQSFAIAGLLDNQTTQSLSKIPGLANIPWLGKLFQSVSTSRSNTELIVIVTPELVRPMDAGKPLPQIEMPEKFMKGVSPVPPQTPGADVTGAPAIPPRPARIPVEQLKPKTQDGADSDASPAPAGAPKPPTPGGGR